MTSNPFDDFLNHQRKQIEAIYKLQRLLVAAAFAAQGFTDDHALDHAENLISANDARPVPDNTPQQETSE